MSSEEKTTRVPDRNFLTIPEVAAARGVSRVAVLHSIRTGKLRAYRVPGKRDWFIERADAERYAATPVRRSA